MSKQEEKQSSNVPTVLVIFGITGDLARKKLIPALFSLYQEKKLPSHFHVVGFSRRALPSDAFVRYLKETLSVHRKDAEGGVKPFLQLFSFVSGHFENRSDYEILAATLTGIDVAWGMCANKLFYCAVSPEFYKIIFKNLEETHLTDSCNTGGEKSTLSKTADLLTGWTRVIVEKPFGHDLATARALDEFLGRLFTEDQLYRIDHYLAKEMLQNILLFRFANNLFEKNWSNEMVERINIRLWEKIGVEDRGSFYDSIGALRDVGQNHLLQMLALVTMQRPTSFRPQAIREARAELLKNLMAPSRHEIKRSSFRAQYKGYPSIKGVQKKSQTETYFRIQAKLSHPQWHGVPIMLESGKRMGEQHKEIEVVFRHPLPCLCPSGASGGHYKNRVVFSLEPEEKITIHFWSKKPGFVTEMEERTFEFLLRDSRGKTQYVEEYQKLLLDCIAGDQTLFVGTGEIRSMWRFVDPVVRAWQSGAVPLKRYQPDTNQWCTRILTSDATNKPKQRLLLPAARVVGLVGLGKMGKNLALHLLEQGWRVVVFDTDAHAVAELVSQGAIGANSICDLVQRLPKPALVWIMVPAGKPVDKVLFGRDGLAKLLVKGDVIIDGGNSFYQDSVSRAKKFARSRIHFLDAGVSGGPEGARRGACIMVGGNKKVYEYCEPLFHDLSVQDGYTHVGEAGAGHFVKMVHNGIEYGMMQAIAEGFSVMKKSPFKLDLSAIADLYNHGSVVESRLVGWLASGFQVYGQDLQDISGAVGATGEGEWTIESAKKLKIPVPVIKQAFQFRIASRKTPSYTGKILSALRNQFGGHATTLN